MFVNLSLADFFALAAVMLVGLPHGAFDGVIAFILGYGRSIRKITGFLVMYLLLVGLGLTIWMVSPVFALAAFLIMTIIHFGSGDLPEIEQLVSGRITSLQKPILTFAHGCLVPVFLPLAHQAEVQTLFTVLAGPNIIILFDGLNMLAFLWVASLLVYLYLAFQMERYRRSFAEIILLSAGLFILPPLVGFALYFCCVHSRRHFISMWITLNSLMQRSHIIITAVALTIMTWAGAGVFFGLQLSGGMVSSDMAALRTVFILLAALTVPHMILVDCMFSPLLKRVRADG
jgi:Brp/Blh family beta-carotene 15,15'-monooxygenase